MYIQILVTIHRKSLDLLNTGSAFLVTRVYKDTVKIRITVTRVSTPSAGLYYPPFVWWRKIIGKICTS